jgi:hypothetical protein
MLNATRIARLLCRSLPWAWRRLDAGCYGEPVRRGGRAVWVPVSAVEAAERVRFTPVQLAAAGAEIGGMQEAA